MKKLLVISVLIFTAMTSMGQSIQVTAFSGYTFGDKFLISSGRAKLSGGHTYGGMFTFGLGRFNEIELEYRRQDATATAESSIDDIDVTDPVSVNYVLVGANRLLPVGSSLDLMTLAKIGVGIIDSKTDSFETITKFAFSASIGLKYHINPVVALRVQGNFSLPVVNAGAGLWWSPGSGANIGVSGWSPITQFGFTGGLVFNIK